MMIIRSASRRVDVYHSRSNPYQKWEEAWGCVGHGNDNFLINNREDIELLIDEAITRVEIAGGKTKPRQPYLYSRMLERRAQCLDSEGIYWS